MSCTVQVSSDLLDRQSGVGHTVVEQDSATQLVVRVAQLIDNARPRRFLRLAVQSP